MISLSNPGVFQDEDNSAATEIKQNETATADPIADFVRQEEDGTRAKASEPNVSEDSGGDEAVEHADPTDDEDINEKETDDSEEEEGGEGEEALDEDGPKPGTKSIHTSPMMVPLVKRVRVQWS